MAQPIAKTIARFNSKIERRDSSAAGCWLWRGTVSREGYGRFKIDGTMQLAHRLAHLWHIGPIPDGWHVDHLCRVRNCVNPRHLEAVTQAENNRRRTAVVTRCPRGHSYDDPRICYVDPQGWRQCRLCRQGNDRKRAGKRSRRRAEASRSR